MSSARVTLCLWPLSAAVSSQNPSFMLAFIFGKSMLGYNTQQLCWKCLEDCYVLLFNWWRHLGLQEHRSNAEGPVSKVISHNHTFLGQDQIPETIDMNQQWNGREYHRLSTTQQTPSRIEDFTYHLEFDILTNELVFIVWPICFLPKLKQDLKLSHSLC